MEGRCDTGDRRRLPLDGRRLPQTLSQCPYTSKAPAFFLQYDDLHRMVYRLATSTGLVKVTFDASVTAVSIDETSGLPHALLANGEFIQGDVIVGADGYRSVVRDAVTDQEYEGTSTGMSVWT